MSLSRPNGSVINVPITGYFERLLAHCMLALTWEGLAESGKWKPGTFYYTWQSGNLQPPRHNNVCNRAKCIVWWTSTVHITKYFHDNHRNPRGLQSTLKCFFRDYFHLNSINPPPKRLASVSTFYMTVTVMFPKYKLDVSPAKSKI